MVRMEEVLGSQKGEGGHSDKLLAFIQPGLDHFAPLYHVGLNCQEVLQLAAIRLCRCACQTIHTRQQREGKDILKGKGYPPACSGRILVSTSYLTPRYEGDPIPIPSKVSLNVAL